MLQVSIQSIEAIGTAVRVRGKLIPTGNYATGGDTVDFTAAAVAPVVLDPSFSGVASAIPSSQPLTQFDVWTQGGNLTDVYIPKIGSAQNNNLVLVQVASTGSELAPGAYPAAVLNDNIGFIAVFQKLQ